MNEATKTKGVGTAAGKPALMYPNNSLKAQVRDPKEALSAFTVLNDAIKAAK